MKRRVFTKAEKLNSLIERDLDSAIFCPHCILDDCIRTENTGGPAHDPNYIEECVLALARYANLPICKSSLRFIKTDKLPLELTFPLELRLTGVNLAILRLMANGYTSVKELAEKRKVARTSIDNSILYLRVGKFIEKKSSKRNSVWTLTEKGHMYLEKGK